MSKHDDRAGGDQTAAPGEKDAWRKPLSEVMPAFGVADVLRRLEEHRAAGTRHTIGESIAVGGMGEILKVSDQDLGRELAMKIPRRDISALGSTQQARVLARFLEEAQVTGQLHHASIVPVHELSIDTQGRPYFTMPLIRGWDFSEIIRFVDDRQQDWTLARALGIVLKTCEAVAYAHSRGVIHRDIKPSNVRVGRFGETYLMDWGLARVLGRQDTRDIRVRDSDIPRSSAVHTERSKLKSETPDSPLVTMDGDVVGTPHYMSPEQARGESEHVGPRSDVYSIGALLYHLLAGRAPYAPSEGALSQRAVWSLVLDGPPKDLRDLAPDSAEELVEICRKAMKRDAKERYPNAQALALDIEAFLDRRPVKAHAPTVVYALRLFYERNRDLVLVGAAACVLLAGVSGWLWSVAREAQAADRATQQLANDGLLVTALQTETSGLFPATPSMLERLDRWLKVTGELLKRREGYEAELQVESEGSSKQATLSEHLAKLDWLRSEQAAIAQRREIALQLVRTSQIEPAAMWNEVSADTKASGSFGAFEVVPQIGLVPLWKNAQGYWEFWHVNSGARPAGSDAASRGLAAEDGITLVLLPGGSAELGSPEDEPGRGQQSTEALHTIKLAPYFISKYEITQAQWLRAMGENPSRFRPENLAKGEFTLLHPVESVTWNQASEFAFRLDLKLPDEDQWEFACRAGENSAYYWGDSPDGLQEHENILDESGGANVPPSRAAWNDRFVRHAPIGWFAPNGYGLFDMLGNVSEWCAGAYIVDPGSGLSGEGDESPGIPLRSYRGGAWSYPPRSGEVEPNRCAYRLSDAERAVVSSRGLRVARECRQP